MICPSCRSELTETQLAHGVFWSCDRCGGRALTIELLRRTFSPEAINSLWLRIMENEGTPGRPCPLCARPLLTISLSGATAESRAIDACKSCHLVWFDRGEVENLPPRAPEQSQTAEAALSPAQKQALAIVNTQLLAEENRIHDEAEVWKHIGRFFDYSVPG